MHTGLRLFMRLCFTMAMLIGTAQIASAAAGRITVYWTAPGDDSLSGRATVYDLRFALMPITSANFAIATRATGMAQPKPAGSAESFAITNLQPGLTYYFAIRTADEAGNWSRLSNLAQGSISTTAVRSPLAVYLSAPSPNPARGGAHWTYSLAQPGPMDIDIYDAAGRHVASVENGWKSAGERSVMWDLRDAGGRTVAPGLYLVRARFAGRTETKRLTVLR